MPDRLFNVQLWYDIRMRSTIFFERITLLFEPFVPVLANRGLVFWMQKIRSFMLSMYPLPVVATELFDLLHRSIVFCKNLCSDSSNANGIVRVLFGDGVVVPILFCLPSKAGMYMFFAKELYKAV